MKGIQSAGFIRFPAVFLVVLVFTSSAWGGDWSISLFGGGASFNLFPSPPPPPRIQVYGPAVDYDYYEYEGSPANPPGTVYYPAYPPNNPVIQQNSYGQRIYAPDGTVHDQGVVEDRHSSYYSPGRNEAITRPRTTVERWNYGQGTDTTRERTTWIGSDGRPHSTTIDRNTQTDPWGNTRTDTHIDLKRRPAGPAYQGQPSMGQVMPQPYARREQFTPQTIPQTSPQAVPQTMPQRRVSPQPLVPMAPPGDEPIKLMPKPATKSAAPQQSPAASSSAAPSTNIETPAAAAPVPSW